MLDSLQLVMFVVAVEDRVLSETGKEIGLTGNAALQAAPSPHSTVGSLATFVGQLLDS